MPASEFLDVNGNWQCTKCGNCCRMMFLVPALKDFDLGDGTCRHLTPDNECDIYDTRPELCRVKPADGSRLLATACEQVQVLVKILRKEK